MQDKIGALKPGMYADLVLLDGNPLVQLYDLLNVAVVMKAGRIVVDKR
jgi:imidazolonepropionase-like amidohydrolase